MDKQLEALEKDKVELVKFSNHFLNLAREKEKAIKSRIVEMLNEKYKGSLGLEKFTLDNIYVFSKECICDGISTRHAVLMDKDGDNCLFCGKYVYYT